MAINQGQVKSYDVSQTSSNAHPAGVGQTPDVRRIYNFGDRVADLTPEESPFFVYLSKVSKVPTDDSVFRYLEDRSKIDWTSRDFALAAAVNGGSAVSAGSTYSFSVDANSDSVDWLIKGMVFAVETADGSADSSADKAAAQAIVEANPEAAAEVATAMAEAAPAAAADIAAGVAEANPEDIILINDVDEIPNLEKTNLKQINQKLIFFEQI